MGMNLDDTRGAAQKFANFFRMFEDINEFVESVNQLVTLKKEAETAVASMRTESGELESLIATNQKILTSLQSGVDEERKSAKVWADAMRADAATEIEKMKQVARDQLAKDQAKVKNEIGHSRASMDQEHKNHQDQISQLDAMARDKKEQLQKLNTDIQSRESRLKDIHTKLEAIKATI